MNDLLQLVSYSQVFYYDLTRESYIIVESIQNNLAKLQKNTLYHRKRTLYTNQVKQIFFHFKIKNIRKFSTNKNFLISTMS